ncbi:MAG TPA: DbpA RNA binding domain-containing protein, partial [Alcanivorax sp.]|nr:DbpA RNA binding domain-containing protein [Alcanivorax sp.]
LNSFRERLAKGLEHPEMDANRALVADLTADLSMNEADLAAVLASLLFNKEPLFLKAAPEGKPFQDGGDRKAPRKADRNKGAKPARDSGPMKIYRVEVGETHGVRPGNLVGAIANEGGLSSAQIGAIRIHSDHSTVQLPEGLSTRQLHQLRTARVCQRALGLEAV